MTIRVEKFDDVTVVTIDRPSVRNAVDRPTADALADAFRAFEADDNSNVAILTGAGGHFCAGADLKAVASGEGRNRLEVDGDGPMGPSRMVLSKPVIAAIEGFAVAGGLELACWCDLRVVADDAKLGVFCRRWGVPLIDGGTVRLPRIIGLGRALDLILTGREVPASEAFSMGLANRICPPGEALNEAITLAKSISAFPQMCLRADRNSAYQSFDFDKISDALRAEFEAGVRVVASESIGGATRFAQGLGRHGEFE